jgi:hypothetical protein
MSSDGLATREITVRIALEATSKRIRGCAIVAGERVGA